MMESVIAEIFIRLVSNVYLTCIMAELLLFAITGGGDALQEELLYVRIETE